MTKVDIHTDERPAPAAGVEPTRSARTYRPLVDILDRENELVLRADLPGADKDGLELRFESGTLLLRARVKPRLPDKANWLLREYGVGDFERRFAVSEILDASRITAEYADGVLTIHLPKVESAKPRRIPVLTA